MPQSRRLLPLFALSCTALPAFAQESLPPAAVPGGVTTPKPPSNPTSQPAPPSGVLANQLPQGDLAQQAGALVSEALDIAFSNREARPVTVKTAATLLARLPGSTEETNNRDAATARWMQLLSTEDFPVARRQDALSAFFEGAVATDAAWARSWALKTPYPAARAGAFLRLSRSQGSNWSGAEADALLAQRAARQEENALLRARALTFFAGRQTELGAADQDVAIREASSNIRLLATPSERDYLLAELVSAAARYDLGLARKIAGDVSEERLKNLATSRVNIAEISQTTLTTRSKERVQALATAAAPYDVRALPFLLQLPASDESVLKAINQVLPPIYPGAQRNLSIPQLEQLWAFSKSAPEGPQRDQLQSRIARLMVLEDLWRGRDWGKQLAWKGGRIQVGAFLKAVLESRQSQLHAGALQDIASRNVARALYEARQLPPAARAEALLLLAGQILG